MHENTYFTPAGVIMPGMVVEYPDESGAQQLFRVIRTEPYLAPAGVMMVCLTVERTEAVDSPRGVAGPPVRLPFYAHTLVRVRVSHGTLPISDIREAARAAEYERFAHGQPPLVREFAPPGSAR